MDIDGAILYFCISMPVTGGTVKYLQNDKANNTIIDYLNTKDSNALQILWLKKSCKIRVHICDAISAPSKSSMYQLRIFKF